MPDEGPNVHNMQADIRLLQHGQQHIQQAVTGMSSKLDGVVDALTTLVRLTEKHDALSARVRVLEDSSAERGQVANTGRQYMFAASIVGPIALIVLGWLFQQNMVTQDKFEQIMTKLAKHETHYESHR